MGGQRHLIGPRSNKEEGPTVRALTKWEIGNKVSELIRTTIRNSVDGRMQGCGEGGFCILV